MVAQSRKKNPNERHTKLRLISSRKKIKPHNRHVSLARYRKSQ